MLIWFISPLPIPYQNWVKNDFLRFSSISKQPWLSMRSCGLHKIVPFKTPSRNRMGTSDTAFESWEYTFRKCVSIWVSITFQHDLIDEPPSLNIILGVVRFPFQWDVCTRHTLWNKFHIGEEDWIRHIRKISLWKITLDSRM